MGASSKYLGGLGAALCLTLVAADGRSNDGTPPWIHALVQSGQDIELTLAIVGGGEPGFDEAYDVERSGPDGDYLVLDDHQFGNDEVVDSYDRCRGWSDEQYCADNPGDCMDCDGDGVDECVIEDSWCETVNYVEVVDYCVPAGTTEYVLGASAWGGEQDSDTIEVADSGEECTPPGAGGGTGRCSTSWIGCPPGATGGLLALLCGVGLLALRRR